MDRARGRASPRARVARAALTPAPRTCTCTRSSCPGSAGAEARVSCPSTSPAPLAPRSPALPLAATAGRCWCKSEGRLGGSGEDQSATAAGDPFAAAGGLVAYAAPCASRHTSAARSSGRRPHIGLGPPRDAARPSSEPLVQVQGQVEVQVQVAIGAVSRTRPQGTWAIRNTGPPSPCLGRSKRIGTVVPSLLSPITTLRTPSSRGRGRNALRLEQRAPLARARAVRAGLGEPRSFGASASMVILSSHRTGDVSLPISQPRGPEGRSASSIHGGVRADARVSAGRRV
jgi:hypothetical protein